MKRYDVIVIGSGGGAKITTPAARLGLKVASIERESLGGTCLNRGCIPSKMLIHPGDVAEQIRSLPKFDIRLKSSDMEVDFERLVNRISDTVDRNSAGIAKSYERNPQIDFFHAEARFISNKVIEVDGQQITSDKIFVAVGTRPSIPAIDGLSDTPYWTSTEALRNTVLPERLIVIGAGYIGVELGHAYGALGSEVDFLVRSRFLRKMDAQTSEEFTRVFSRRYNVHFDAVPVHVEHVNGVFSVVYQDKDKNEHTLQAEALLVATGITPNTDTLHLENTDIKTDDHGYIRVDKHMETLVKGTYAFGDCIGRYFFRHTVNFEGEYLFKTVFEGAPLKPIAYPPVPYAVFTHPQVAGVGATEEELRAEGADYVVGLNPYKKSAMGMALLSDHGFCKILVDRQTRRILGAHIVGEEASNMIHMLIAFMYKDGTLDDLLQMIYIHPALPEIVRNAARVADVEFQKPKTSLF